jgi:surfeit locus 1 family protein
MPAGPHEEPRKPRSTLVLGLLGVLILAMIAGLLTLGVWQVERRAWKLDLIRQVDARVHAPASPAPGLNRWPAITRDTDQYRHVVLRGRFDNERETLTQAVTDLGPGFWVMTPFRTDAGFTVLINRGYVSPERRAPDSRAAGRIDGETTVQGLLRITEPKGGFLRANAPAVDSWRSRDVQAIAARRGLTDVAPYFVDADDTPNAGGWPVGGLTVIRFPNSHLVYALTWFGLAAMLATGGAFLVWDERRVRQALK